jgi:ribonuclease T1
VTSARARSLLAGLVVVALVVLALVLNDGSVTAGAPPVSTPRVSTPGVSTPGVSTPATAAPSPTTASSGRDPETGLRWVQLGTLPREAQRTVTLIEAGGPYPYGKDGATFGNRERILPVQRAGFYREYTVVTPGEGDRGARRIVAGDEGRQLFYTGDHYSSFVRIRR